VTTTQSDTPDVTFQGVALHNMPAMIAADDGARRLCRAPLDVHAQLNPMARVRNFEATGGELRFNLATSASGLPVPGLPA